eukprot:8846696-Pyramimonas_sp.AAC.1
MAAARLKPALNSAAVKLHRQPVSPAALFSRQSCASMPFVKAPSSSSPSSLCPDLLLASASAGYSSRPQFVTPECGGGGMSDRPCRLMMSLGSRSPPSHAIARLIPKSRPSATIPAPSSAANSGRGSGILACPGARRRKPWRAARARARSSTPPRLNIGSSNARPDSSLSPLSWL